MRQRVLIDIRRRGEKLPATLRPPEARYLLRAGAAGRTGIQLSPVLRLEKEKQRILGVTKWAKRAAVSLSIAAFFTGFVLAPTSGVSVAAQDTQAQRKQLEAQLADLEKQISQYESKISDYSKQGNTLKSEIKKLEARIAKLNLQIKVINLSLARLDGEITNTENNISAAEASLSADRMRLGNILQSVNEADHEHLISILLRNAQLSDFIADVNNLLVVEDSVRELIIKIAATRQELVDQKEVLASEREDTTALKEYQVAQVATIQKTQSEKTDLLKVTKGKESEYQKLLTVTQQSAAQIRQQIFTLLGGGQLQFGDAYKLAQLAEKATGVRAALLLAVLDRESALGKNVGQCGYRTAMRPSEQPIFLAIVGEVGLQSNLASGVLKVSCPNSDGTYGGAIGPAQFLPSTWNLYKDRVAAITGSNPPSPWSNQDAFIATALYLKDAGASGADARAERIAAAKYYAGNRWRNYLWTYGDRVISLAQQFQDDIAVLGG